VSVFQAAGTYLQRGRPDRIFYGWRLVGTSMVTLALLSGTSFHGVGVFFVALVQQFGWSRTAISVDFSMGRVEGGLLGPPTGYLTDRLGTRRMVLIGLGLLGAGFVALSFTNGLPMFFGAFALVFLGNGLGGFLPLMTAINHWFRRLRTTAMAIAMTGNSLGGLLVPVLAWAIVAHGWRATALGLGLTIWAAALPLSMMVRNRPEEYGLRPDGDSGSRASADGERISETDDDDESFTVAEAVRTPTLWLITAVHGFSGAALSITFVHIAPHLADRGLSLPVVGSVVMTYTVIGAVSQLLAGVIGDRLPKPPLIAAFVALQGVGVVIAVNIADVTTAFIFAILFGLGIGGRTALLTAIRGDYFGRKSFATILGITQLPMNALWMTAPIIAGYLFDTTGSYTAPFLGVAALNFLAAALILAARKPALPASRSRDDASAQIKQDRQAG
jgi:MFS family permease